jgi:hypothetical protein
MSFSLYSYGYRNPKTTQERRWYYPHKKYARKKRAANMLRSSYDDISVKLEGGWKKRRKKQYHTNGRGKKHTICLRDFDSQWNIERYLKKQNIPHRIRKVCQREKRSGFWNYFWNKLTGRTEREWVEKEWYQSYHQHDEITYWTDKNIGVEYII